MSKNTNKPTTLNIATNTRATLQINSAPDLSFTSNQFAIPSISTTSALQPTPFTDIPHQGDKLRYAPLEFSFLVNEDFSNWKFALNWLEGFTVPRNPSQWTNKELIYSDATVLLYSSHYNLILEINFYDCVPTYLGALRFTPGAQNTEELVCDITMDYSRYEIANMRCIEESDNLW